MQWDDSPNAGFTSGTPWLPVHEGYRTENAEAEEKDPSSVLNWYRALASLRAEETVLTDGSFTELFEDDPYLYAFRRKNGDAELITIVNFSGNTVKYGLAEESDCDVLLSSFPHETGVMKPYESCVIKKR